MQSTCTCRGKVRRRPSIAELCGGYDKHRCAVHGAPALAHCAVVYKLSGTPRSYKETSHTFFSYSSNTANTQLESNCMIEKVCTYFIRLRLLELCKDSALMAPSSYCDNIINCISC